MNYTDALFQMISFILGRMLAMYVPGESLSFWGQCKHSSIKPLGLFRKANSMEAKRFVEITQVAHVFKKWSYQQASSIIYIYIPLFVFLSVFLTLCG